MNNDHSQRRLRIPVRNVDGVWECFYGGLVPVRPGSLGELIVDRGSIADKAFLNRMEARSRLKVLEQDTALLVSLGIRKIDQVPVDAAKHLVPFEHLRDKIATEHLERWNPEFLQFVEVSLSEPTSAQARQLETTSGGLWLLTQGIEAKGLTSTQVALPKAVSEEPAGSLNHAFTKLSEVYEPWRISHTGNVYTRILYEEKDGRWYPLDLLRNAALAKQEQEIAHGLWADFMARMNSQIRT